MPTANCPFRSSTAVIDNRQARLLSAVFGRLKPGVELAQAQADAASVAANMQRAYPDVYPDHIGYAAQVDRLDTVLTQAARPTFLILLGTTALVLLIVCANVVNLNLARVLQNACEIEIDHVGTDDQKDQCGGPKQYQKGGPGCLRKHRVKPINLSRVTDVIGINIRIRTLHVSGNRGGVSLGLRQFDAGFESAEHSR